MNHPKCTRSFGIALGLAAALIFSGLVGGRLGGGNLAILSECDGSLEEIVIHYVSGSDAVRPVYRDFLRQVDKSVSVNVICPDQASYDALIHAVGAVRCKMRPRVVGHEMTVWSRDRWVALRSPHTGPVTLLAPRGEAGADNWPARKGDEQLVFDIAAGDESFKRSDAIVARRSGLYFEGGDFLADATRVFVAPAVVRANLKRTVDSVQQLTSELQRALGRPIVLLTDAPEHHAGMFMMAAGDNVMLVGDPSLARSLIDSESTLPPLPDGADWSHATQARFDAVARQVAALGYRVVRIPTVVSNDQKSYLTYVNVVTDHRSGQRIVFLPQYRGAGVLNELAAQTWRELGYEVRAVDCTSTYRLFGNLHCLVNIVRRS